MHAPAMTSSVARPSRPPLRLWLGVWAGTALALSWVLWALNGSFYGRFGVPSGDWPEWSLLDALLGPSALVGWAMVLGLHATWPRRARRFAALSSVVVVAAIAAAALWVGHEADRARAGTPVATGPFVSSFGGLRFSARAVTAFPE